MLTAGDESTSESSGLRDCNHRPTPDFLCGVIRPATVRVRFGPGALAACGTSLSLSRMQYSRLPALFNLPMPLHIATRYGLTKN
jgi:hypothetical protein